MAVENASMAMTRTINTIALVGSGDIGNMRARIWLITESYLWLCLSILPMSNGFQ